ncbi:lysophospholipase L1-like esterase [Bradyrhizobium sp. AZCC 1610]|uniref:GDSL-type esterase/lipase family protein n=1 Tax=Bradyrhizobium sp. AZCC 1610 TaxID=3117020 RepID=UPI002FF19E3D
MSVLKFRKGEWVLLNRSKKALAVVAAAATAPIAGLSAATVSADGKTYTGRGVKPGSTVTVFANGSVAGTATADGSGNWSYTFATAPNAGSVIGWDGTLSAPTTTAPAIAATLSALTLSNVSFTAGAAAGTVIGNISGKTAGSTLSVTPNDGKVAINAGQTGLVVGLSASAAGTTSYTITETLAGATNTPRSTTFSITANPAVVPFNSRLVIEGDSITAGSNGPQWAWAALARTRGRYYMPQNYNQATGGQTAAQMATQVSAINALSPKVVNALMGTNDLGGSSDTPATIWANIKTCWKGYLDGTAAYVNAGTVMRRTDTNFTNLGAGREADRVTLNNLIKGYATDPDLANYKDKIRVVDLESVFNPATDALDGLHPNWLGAIKIGNAFGDSLNSLIDTSSVLTDLYNSASTNLILLAGKNALLTGTAGTLSGTPTPIGPAPTNWTLSHNDSFTVTSAQPTMNGAQAFEVVASGTNTTANRVANFSSTCAYTGNIGDQMEFCVDFSLAAGHQGIRAISLTCDTGATPSNVSSVVMDGAGAISGTLRTYGNGPLTTSKTSSTLQCLVTFAAGPISADITWGRPYFRKVPAGA